MSFNSCLSEMTVPLPPWTQTSRMPLAMCWPVYTDRFSPTDAPIGVTMERRGEIIDIAVTDRCGGIPAERRNELFQRFGKLRPGGPGLGLGLYISRGIARAHGGDVLYEPPGTGDCRFVLRLPLDS